MITFKWHPPLVFSFELVIFQVSVPWQQICSWGLLHGSLHLHLPCRGLSKALPEHCRLNLASFSLALTEEALFVCCLSSAAWMLPLMHFLIVFSLLQGELAQTFLRVLTQFNEQLMNGSRIRVKKDCNMHELWWEKGFTAYPSAQELWLPISLLYSKSAQKGSVK